MGSTRLTKDDWLSAGLDALRQDGPQALAAEPMARRIGTTKGSFYWHFKDVPDYHALLLSAWRGSALRHLSDQLSSGQPADQRLRDFGHAILADRTESRLRIWSLSDTAVARALAEIDGERLTYVALLLRELGLGNRNFARALQASLIGLPQLDADADTALATFDTLVDTVLALAE